MIKGIWTSIPSLIFEREKPSPCLKISPLTVSSKSRIFNDGLKLVKEKCFEVIWGEEGGKKWIDLLDVQTFKVFTFFFFILESFSPAVLSGTYKHTGVKMHMGSVQPSFWQERLQPLGSPPKHRGFGRREARCITGRESQAPARQSGMASASKGTPQGDGSFPSSRSYPHHGRPAAHCPPETRACRAARSLAPNTSALRWSWSGE